MNIEILTPEQNEAMNYKPVLAPVVIGVITPYGYDYKAWIERIGILKYPKAKFIKVSRIDDIRGVEFNGLEYGYQYWKIKADIVDAAKCRVRLP